MNLASRLNMRVSWEAKTGGDEWEGTTYSDAVDIPAFKREITVSASGAGGIETRAVDNVWVTEDVALGDRIDGHIVETREAIVDPRSGETLGYKLYCEPVSRS